MEVFSDYNTMIPLHNIAELIFIEMMDHLYNQYTEQIELCTLNIFCVDIIDMEQMLCLINH